MTDPVMAIRTSGTNADLIADAAELGYLSDDMQIFDATYGKGNFWTKFRPSARKFSANDLYVAGNDFNGCSIFNFDFRDLPYIDARFDAVVFDPPYKLQGTSSNAGPASSNAAYGMDREYLPVKDHQTLVRDGLVECWRVLKPGGFLLYKTMDMVVSGHVEWQTVDAVDEVEDEVEDEVDRDEIDAIRQVRLYGGRLVDWLMLMGRRKQPERTRKCPECKGNGWKVSLDLTETDATKPCAVCSSSGRVPSPQMHAARNYSSLLVFRKGR